MKQFKIQTMLQNMKQKTSPKEKRAKGLRLFPRMALSYLIFALFVSAAFAVSLLVTVFFVTGNNLNGLVPSEIVNEQGRLIDLDPYFRLGAWVEKLDETYNLIEVYGEKKSKDQSYSTEELLSLGRIVENTEHLAKSSANAEYYAYSYPYTEQVETSGETKTKSGIYLLFYDRRNISHNTVLNISNMNSDPGWWRMFILLFGTLFVLSGLLMSWYLNRQIKRPLQALRQGMQKVESGDDTVRLDFKASPDFIELKDSFNRMIIEIETQKREKALAEEKKQRLLLELSHDLRTPVSTIKGCASALSENLVPEGEQERYYQIISDKADRVTALSEDMFAMLKIEDGNSPIQTKTIDLNEFLRRFAASYYSEIESKHLQFDLDLPEETMVQNADPALLSRAIGNLLENAMKYNLTGKKIILSAQDEVDKITIAVLDDGQPISKQERTTLFEPFMRVDKARKSNEGSGLGLAISKAIAEKHGGTMRYEYILGYNCFRLDLPK